jgi:AraC family transcriptional regulator
MGSKNDSASASRKSWQLEVGPFQLQRVQAAGPLTHPISVPVASTTSVIVQLEPFRMHRLWRSQTLVYEGAHKPGAVSITNMEEEWKCHHLSAFDNFRIQIAHDHLDELAARSGAGRGFSLRNPAGVVDRTMQLLAGAILPAIDHESTLSQLYLGHIASAMMTHVVSVYGSTLRRGKYVPTLSPRRERLVIEYMRHHLASNISVDDIAAECGISAGHFTKAFFQSTGLTPHQWILRARIEQAKAFLGQGLDLASIAASCGFSDQSHFSRVFKKITGFSPAKWRKK